MPGLRLKTHAPGLHHKPPHEHQQHQHTTLRVVSASFAANTQNTYAKDTPSKPKSLSVAQVAKAIALVNYQDGAVVSREIVKKPTGTVTVFAFDKGEGLSEHTAPFDALEQVLEGEIEIIISGQPYRLHAMILMPAGQPHALKALKRFKMILTMIRS